jgi:hypothetical protein
MDEEEMMFDQFPSLSSLFFHQAQLTLSQLMVPVLFHSEVDGRMTLSRRSLFIVDPVEGSLPSHCFLAVLVIRWVVRPPFHKTFHRESLDLPGCLKKRKICCSMLSRPWRQLSEIACALSDYQDYQNTELIQTQHPTTDRLIAPIAQVQQSLDPETTESILYYNATVLVDPAEMAPDPTLWVVGSKLWVDQVLRF